MWKLVDDSGNSVSLDGDATLCLNSTHSASSSCLAFLDDNDQWKCVDSCLEYDGDLICGTNHIFLLLLCC